ncbi:hypothetical protein GCM10014715_55670 [Streptomyces spiralis]|uniref:Uncharacterized protein n=1 Tax=Streptomyces spiralis TaxID=66376 RepID=A0A919DXZ4_9ACTN|nr:hypothetical protein GCM10014715_55670 [Streptomyces spiralis]
MLADCRLRAVQVAGGSAQRTGSADRGEDTEIVKSHETQAYAWISRAKPWIDLDPARLDDRLRAQGGNPPVVSTVIRTRSRHGRVPTRHGPDRIPGLSGQEHT